MSNLLNDLIAVGLFVVLLGSICWGLRCFGKTVNEMEEYNDFYG